MTTVALGKIVSSESHLLYHVRIYDKSERADPPQSKDYAFGNFVVVNSSTVGVVANSRLINPEGGHFGPRLTIPHSDNAVFAPDYINEVGVSVAILLLGHLYDTGDHNVPTQVVPVGAEVRSMTQDELKRFHHGPEKRFQMRYYPTVAESGLPFSSALMQRICDQLEPLCQAQEVRMLRVLRKNLSWQSTVGQIR